MTLTFCKAYFKIQGRRKERFGVCIASEFGRIMGRKVYKDTSEQNENDEEQSSRHEGHRTNEPGAGPTSGAFYLTLHCSCQQSYVQRMLQM